MTDGLVEEERLLQGRYRLVAPIAKGGMAQVWEGVDEVLTRPVAVKLLHRHLAADAGFRERFRREAVSAARLAHPNVVATFDTGEDGDNPFIVMELVRGRTLRSLLDEGPVRPGLAVAIAAQVADALTCAHAAGIVHRDIKPGNILLCDGMTLGAPASVKVADFGIARAATENTDITDLTQPGTLLGTTKYLAPEQVQGEEPDARSDIYALGVVLYEMVTGRPPFAGDTAMATAMAHVHTEPLKPRQVKAGIPRGLEQVVLRAIEKDPADRYQSAEDFASALRSVAMTTADDDAIPAVVRDATPPVGSPIAFHQSERTWIVPAALIVGAAVVLIALALVLGGSDVGRKLLPGRSDDTTAATGQPIAVSNISVLDPADGNEKNDRLKFAIDADPATTWETSTYSRPDFGGLKDFLALRLDLGSAQTVRRVVVDTPTAGWNASLYITDDGGDDVGRWGKPVAQVQGVGAGSVTLEGFEKDGRFAVIQFTRLGAGNRIEVRGIAVSS